MFKGFSNTYEKVYGINLWVSILTHDKYNRVPAKIGDKKAYYAA